MDSYKKLLKIILVGLLFFTTSNFIAQESKINLAESKLTVFGTSNLHDWDIVAKAMSGKANFNFESNVLKDIESLDFSVESEQLLSGKSGMDSNTFKALNSKKYKTINYKLTKIVKITKVSANTYTIEAQGDLTIAGTTKNITQVFTAVVSGKKVVLSGKTKITMTQYKITPPTALFGTIKTGPDVTVDFKVTYYENIY
jgi:polyisoprenoid-binding protein YceI